MTFVRPALFLIATLLLGAVACTKPETPTTNQTRPAGSPVPAASAPQNEFAVARANFKKDCVTCHRENGSGGPVKLDDGTQLKVPSLREGHALTHKDEAFVKQITNGGDGMPKFGDKLSREETLELVRFIRKEFQGK